MKNANAAADTIRARSLKVAEADAAVKLFDAVTRLTARAARAGGPETVAALVARMDAAEARAVAAVEAMAA